MSTELVKFTEITATVPQVLEQSKSRVEKAKSAGETLLGRIISTMDDKADEEANNYLVKARKTLDLIMKQRKPITQLLDAVKKEFTTLEADLDPKRADSIVARIQVVRNTYATQKLEEQRKREEEAQKQKAIEKERAETRAAIEISWGNWFNDHLAECVKEIHAIFNNATVSSIDSVKAQIVKYSEVYPVEHFEAFRVGVTTLYLTKDDKIALKVEVSDGKYNQFHAAFKAKISEVKADLVSKLPSKKAELEAIAEAEKNNAAEAARLKAEREKREKEENERQAKEKAEADARIKADAEARAKASEMQTLFNTESSVQAKERTGYEMIIKHPAAFGLIFQFWFEHEDKDLAIDQLEKKTLGQMKAFCEKYAHKNSETIQSPYIEYKEQVKVQARK